MILSTETIHSAFTCQRTLFDGNSQIPGVLGPQNDLERYFKVSSTFLVYGVKNVHGQILSLSDHSPCDQKDAACNKVEKKVNCCLIGFTTPKWSMQLTPSV